MSLYIGENSEILRWEELVIVKSTKKDDHDSWMDFNYDVQTLQKVKEMNLDMWEQGVKNFQDLYWKHSNYFSCPSENTSEPLNRKETT